MPEKKEIRLAFDPSDLQIAEEAARRSEVDFQSLPQSQFIDGFSAVLIAGGALLIAKFVLDLIDRFRGGIVIDLRSNGKGSIKRDKAVPAGWAVVLTEDGQVESASTTLRRMHPRGFSKQSSVVPQERGRHSERSYEAAWRRPCEVALRQNGLKLSCKLLLSGTPTETHG